MTDYIDIEREDVPGWFVRVQATLPDGTPPWHDGSVYPTLFRRFRVSAPFQDGGRIYHTDEMWWSLGYSVSPIFVYTLADRILLRVRSCPVTVLRRPYSRTGVFAELELEARAGRFKEKPHATRG